MSGRYMTDGEIAASFRHAADQRGQIRILAELNACGTEEIRGILISRGLNPPKVRRYDPTEEERKTKPRQSRGDAWTEEQTQMLLEMRRHGCEFDDIAEAVGRTEKAVRSHIAYLRAGGVTIDRKRRTVIHQRNAYTEDDARIIVDMRRDGYRDKEIADALGRTVAAIRSRIQVLRKEGVEVARRGKGSSAEH